MSQEHQDPTALAPAVSGAQPAPGEDVSSRDALGRWRPGHTGNAGGMPKGTFSMARAWKQNLSSAPTEAHYEAAAIGSLKRREDVPECETLGALLCWVEEVRALQGHDPAFKEIGDRLDPKPNKVDVSVGPARRSAVPEGSPSDPERESAEEFYDDLAGEG